MRQLGPRIRTWAVATTLVLGALGLAVAAPSLRQWNRAEQLVRDHARARGKEVVELTRKTGTTLGTAFWLRARAAGAEVTGGLVVVRDPDVHSERGDETIRAILRRDRQLQTRAIGARDFLYLLQQLGNLPAGLPAEVVTDSPITAANPRFTYARGRATFIIHAPRPPPRGAPDRPATVTMVRATLSIDTDYQLSWTLVDVELRDPGPVRARG